MSDNVIPRRGKFTVSRKFMETTPFNELRSVFKGIVVWRTEHKFDMDTITYFAECAEFDVRGVCMLPHEYQLVVDRQDGEIVGRSFLRIPDDGNFESYRETYGLAPGFSDPDLDRIAELEAVLCTARDLLAGPNVMPPSEQRSVFAQNLTDVLDRNPVR